MSIRRVWILLGKELRIGATNFLFLYAIVVPPLLSLLIALAFGDLLSQTPRIGIYDPGDSRVAEKLMDMGHVQTTLYANRADLRQSVARGAEEIGIVYPEGFDESVRNGTASTLEGFRWGQASGRNLIIIESALIQAVTEAAGFDMPVSVHSDQLGDIDDATWSQRLLPIIIIMAVMLGGLMIPASSLIDEKQQRTLQALTGTPTTLVDVYLSKTLIGVVVSTLMGILILVINDAMGNQPVLLFSIITLGAIMASTIGILVGTFVENIDGMIAVLKVFGIVLFGPGILALIPSVPTWISRLFPTWYFMNPLLEVSQRGAGLADVAGQIGLLAAMVGALILAVVLVIERQQQHGMLAA